MPGLECFSFLLSVMIPSAGQIEFDVGNGLRALDPD